MHVDEISAVAQDYLKVVWSATEWGGAPITTKGLATRFGSTQANVSETVQRLAGQGLVEYLPYKPVSLTARGSALAVAMVRRHRLIETFLVASLGYDWDEVHDEAERLEHVVSELMIERIDRLLGHPTADPHGDPIPRQDGTVSRPRDTNVLADASPGAYSVVRISDTDGEVLERLQGQGIRPGVRVVLESRGAEDDIRVSGPAGRLLVGDAAYIRVQVEHPSRQPSAG